MVRVLVTVEPRMYREAIALAVQRNRPETCRPSSARLPNGTSFARGAKGRSPVVGRRPLRVAQRRHATKPEVAGTCARWLLLRRTS
jgi:hypothetical protein